MDQDKDSLIAKAEAAHYNRRKKDFIPYFPSPGVCLVNSQKGKYQHV